MGPTPSSYLAIRRELERIGPKKVDVNRRRFKANAEVFGGIKEIKALGREAFFVRQYAKVSFKYAAYQVTSKLYSMLPRYLVEALTFGGFMVACIYFVASGDELSQVVPLMGFFAFAAVRLLPGFQEILASLAQFRFHEYLLFKIHRELVGEPGPGWPARDVQVPPLPFHSRIRLDGIQFSYAGADKAVVTDLTLEISKDSSVALVGMTGAGKTTLVDIVLGLLIPQHGTVRIDETVLTDEVAGRWRQNVGYVPQDVFLVDDTVSRNIALGLDDSSIDRAAVERAARVAHIHEFIVSELPLGYDTVIGERGVRISGGQRQRLGIARALYGDPALLVLDEATSDIDNITEEYITDAIQSLAGKKTLLIVAHRLATIRRCDRILVLSDGRITASGAFDELVATDDAFRRLTRGMHVTTPQ